ncbi:recombinase family protein [Deinococcus alpinitundrae]|uniref:recombinase family protein n=1 Tax=Deinococcus alpinitundrae TaxID=468913 RepID=UPI00137AB1FC|nr:recombinase family protein [Deinococcus alpinitundrae]
MTSPLPLSIPHPQTSLVGGVRVSTDAQADRYGPARQRDDITREAERIGLTVCHWVEEAISGTDHDRAAENEYYALARRHPGLNFMFSHPNRVGRHVEVTVGIARTIHDLGGTVHIAGLGSLRDRRNWRYFLRDAAEAENDHADTVERLSKGKYDKAVTNRWPQGNAPYGYRILRDERGKSTTLEVNPEQAAVVRRIYQDALSGIGTAPLAYALTREGIPSSKGKSNWQAGIIRYVLKNEAYTGRRVFTGPDGRLAVVTFPALISAEEWAHIQKVVQGRRNHRVSRTTRPALFAGHLRCGVCKRSMRVSTNTNAQRREYTYYLCATATTSSLVLEVNRLERCTHRTMHKTAVIDEQAWTLFVTAMQDPAFLASAVTREPVTTPDHTQRIAEIRVQQTQIVTRAVTHNLPDEVVAAALAPLTHEIEQLQRDSQPRPPQALPDMSELANAMRDYLPTLEAFEDRRAALATWSARIHVTPEGVQRLEVDVLHGKKGV